MSGFQGQDRDLSRYNHMSTEELEAILQADFERPDEEESDMEKILYITEVIARRRAGQSTGRYADADEAWRSFVDHYLPEEEQPAFRPDEAGAKKSESRFIRTVLVRAASVVLAIALVAAAGTLTASAFGFNLWAWLTAWTQELFGVENPNFIRSGNDREIPEQLAELHALMQEYGFPDHLLPTYLPEGYEAGAVKYEATSTFVDVYCLLKKEDEFITLNYIMYQSDQVTEAAQKDEDDPNAYERGGVTHYIMTNDETCYAVWTVDNVECGIYGASSREELLEIINSIYGGTP